MNLNARMVVVLALIMAGLHIGSLPCWTAEGGAWELFSAKCDQYYLHPAPEELIPALNDVLARKQPISDFVDAKGIHFFATIAHDDKKFLANLRSMRNAYEVNKKVFLIQIITKAENFTTPEPDSIWNLERLMGEFFARGRKETIVRIISAIQNKKENRIFKITVGQHAIWMLEAYGFHHERIYEVINEEYQKSDVEQKKILGGIISGIEDLKEPEKEEEA